MSDASCNLEDHRRDIASLHAIQRELTERVAALDRLMEAKFVTFKVLVDSQAEKVSLALAAADKAVTKAELATEKRFEGVNEFRQALTDRDKSSVPRAEHEAFVESSRTEMSQLRESVAEKFSSVNTRLDRSEGKGAGVGAMWGWIVGGGGLIVAVITVVLR